MEYNVDYIIVGMGIAGVCFAKKCIESGKTFHIISDDSPSASHVAAGLFNPIVIKRFNPVWRSLHQMELLKSTFSEFEELLGGTYIHEIPVYRIFSNEFEIITWKDKIMSSPILTEFLNPIPIKNHFSNIDAPYGFGEVRGTGWVNISAVIDDFKQKYLNNITTSKLDYDELIDKDGWTYKNVKAKKIIFAEGIKVLQNPYFHWIPIRPNKGETLIIEIKEYLPRVTFNSKNFLMPLGDNKYYVGSTYDRTWEETGITEGNRQKLIEQLEFYYKGNYRILEQRAAFRPTTPNMRPIVGAHPIHPNMYVLNGMGTRGTFNSPDMARELFNYLEYNDNLDDEIKVDRYYKLHP